MKDHIWTYFVEHRLNGKVVERYGPFRASKAERIKNALNGPDSYGPDWKAVRIGIKSLPIN